MWTDNPILDAEVYFDRLETQRQQLPKCDCCGEPIQDEFCYEFDGDLICDECFIEYCNEHYRRAVNE